MAKMNQNYEAYLNKGPTDSQIKTVNALLSASKTAASGWELLNSILEYCPVYFFNEKVMNWLDNCLPQHSQGQMTEIKLKVIEKFIEASLRNHELSKKIISDYLSKIVDFCLSSKYNCHEIHSSLDILILCMKGYGSWFVIRKEQVEKHILSFLDCSSEFTVDKAAIAFLYLQQIGNAGTDNINHKNNFRIAVQKLCSTAHHLFDTFLENRIEMNITDRPNQDGFSFEELPLHADIIVSTVAKRIRNVTIFLKIMLKKSFSAPKQIVPSDLLNVIVRGTAVHYCAHSTTDEEVDYHFCLALNNVQTHLFYLLKILILWLENSALPYSFMISKVLIDSLKNSQQCRCFSLDCVYQEAIYKTLNTWIRISKCGLNSHFQMELIKCIRKDVTPVKTSITLKIQTVNQSKKQKSKSKTVSEPDKENTDVESSNHEIENDRLKCLLALDTLKTLFSSSFVRVDKSTIQDLFKLIISIFNEINTSKCPHPYTTANNRQKLCELLISFYEQETLNTLPFLPVSLNILEGFLSDKNANIADTCRNGLNALERLCQPISIPFPMFSSTPSVPVSDEEQIIGNDEVTITDITTPNEEIDILENRIITGGFEAPDTMEVESSNSEHDFDRIQIPDMPISDSCFGSSNINTSETVTHGTIISETNVPETDQLQETNIIDTFVEVESEPEVKRIRMETEEITEKDLQNTSVHLNDTIKSEESDSFVDEVEED